jgi:hypothetical protein
MTVSDELVIAYKKRIRRVTVTASSVTEKEKSSMAKFEPLAALKKLVENDEAPTVARVEALKQIPHPPLALLRRIFVRRCPPRLYALAALAFSREIKLRKEKAKWKPVVRPQRRKIEAGDDGPVNTEGNALGI